MSPLAKQIKEAVECNGLFLSTGSLASWLKVSRAAIIDALDEIHAAQPDRFVRVHGFEGGLGPL